MKPPYHMLMRPAPKAPSVRTGHMPPIGMSAMCLDPEVREGMERIALDVWMRMVNQGRSLQDCILAVYLSGVENAISAGRDSR